MTKYILNSKNTPAKIFFTFDLNGVLKAFKVSDETTEHQVKWLIRFMPKNINELKNDYPSASILKDNRIVYNIKGNNYRLIVKFNFEYQICWIRFIGTHAEYDKIDANNI